MTNKKADDFYEISVDRGGLSAMEECAFQLYNNGDRNKSFEYCKRSADEGIVPLMHKCALMLYNGDGVEMNKSEAARYFEMSANRNVDESIIKYGIMLYEGDGVPVNKKKAFPYLKKGTELGDINSMFYYGLMLYNSDSKLKEKEGIEYIRKAADLGHVEAMFQIALILQDGSEDTDLENARHYFKMAADRGHSKAYKYYRGLNYKLLYFEAEEKFKKMRQENKDIYDKHIYLNPFSPEILPYHERIFKLYDEATEIIQRFAEDNKAVKDLGYKLDFIYDPERLGNEIALSEIKKIKDLYDKYKDQIEGYKQLFNEYDGYLKGQKSLFEQYKNDRKGLLQIQVNINKKMETYINLVNKYNSLDRKAEEFFPENYYPKAQRQHYLDFSEQLKKQISTLDVESIGVDNVNPDQMERLLEIVQGMASDVSSIQRLANHLFNRKPLSSKYYTNNISTTNNWNVSLFNNPLYSDDHPPIICNSEKEFQQLLKILYRDMDDFDKEFPLLGGARFLEAYNRMYKDLQNESYYSVRSPNSLGVQRDTDPNCLFNLIKSGQLKLLNIYRNNDDPQVNIVVQNNTYNILPYVVHRGTVIDLPIGQQPMFIAITYNGTINPESKRTISLNWHCMYDTAHKPTSGFKLSPFIYVVPDDLNFGSSPYSNIWWDNVQPNRSGRISETNKLWTPQTNKPNVDVIPPPNIEKGSENWNFLPMKSGGLITDRLFKLLDYRKNEVITKLDGVVFNNREVPNEDSSKVKLISNQMGLVVRSDKHILIYKNEEGFWDGFTLFGGSWERDVASYSDNDNKNYYVDYPNINIPKGTMIGQLINGMRSDPNAYDSVFYNSQHSRHFLLGTIGASIPNLHCGQILNSNVYNLVDWNKPPKKH